MFWKMCGVPVKGACPIQFAPSPPICVTASVRRSGSQTAMPWQPMPPSARDPSGTTVDVLCGQPEQKAGRRTSPLGASAAPLEPAAHDLGDARGREFADARYERPPVLVLLAEQARSTRLVVEQACDLVLDDRPLLLDDQHVLEPGAEAAHALGLERPAHADLVEHEAELRGAPGVDAELVERLAHVLRRLAGGDDAE